MRCVSPATHHQVGNLAGLCPSALEIEAVLDALAKIANASYFLTEPRSATSYTPDALDFLSNEMM